MFSSLIPNNAYIYLIFSLIVLFLRNSLFSLLAFYFSTYITNKFFTIISPLLVWFSLLFFSKYLQIIPSYLDFTRIYTMNFYFNTTNISLIWIICITFLGFIVFYFLIKTNLKKRIHKC